MAVSTETVISITLISWNCVCGKWFPKAHEKYSTIFIIKSMQHACTEIVVVGFVFTFRFIEMCGCLSQHSWVLPSLDPSVRWWLKDQSLLSIKNSTSK